MSNQKRWIESCASIGNNSEPTAGPLAPHSASDLTLLQNKGQGVEDDNG